MRLNKYIASSGVTSRRKADELTQNGNVKINGIVIKEMGYDVKEGDVVTVNGNIVNPSNQKPVYIALNKPIGYITSSKDEQNRPTVQELIKDIDARLFAVGRLDYNTSGLIIMTNDGEFAQKLAHPKNKIVKTYMARVSGVMSKEKLYKLRNGVDIGGYVTKKAVVNVIKQAENSAIVEVKITEGKNRQVRKMFKAIGSKVQDLERVAIGELRLGRMLSGHYRKLTREELQELLGTGKE